MSHHRDEPATALPADYWEARYSNRGQVWSGRVNPVLAEVAATLAPGRSLDLGCGEGADVIWLAQLGWDATGVDISPTAVARADEAALAAGLSQGRTHFVAGDLATYAHECQFDLVSASYLHARVELPRIEILRRAAQAVAPGGHLLITSHAQAPWGSDEHPGQGFPSLQEELASLGLGDDWFIELAEQRPREHHHGGRTVTVDDLVILARRVVA